MAAVVIVVMTLVVGVKAGGDAQMPRARMALPPSSLMPWSSLCGIKPVSGEIPLALRMRRYMIELPSSGGVWFMVVEDVSRTPARRTI